MIESFSSFWKFKVVWKGKAHLIFSPLFLLKFCKRGGKYNDYLKCVHFEVGFCLFCVCGEVQYKMESSQEPSVYERAPGGFQQATHRPSIFDRRTVSCKFPLLFPLPPLLKLLFSLATHLTYVYFVEKNHTLHSLWLKYGKY